MCVFSNFLQTKFLLFGYLTFFVDEFVDFFSIFKPFHTRDHFAFACVCLHLIEIMIGYSWTMRVFAWKVAVSDASAAEKSLVNICGYSLTERTSRPKIKVFRRQEAIRELVNKVNSGNFPGHDASTVHWTHILELRPHKRSALCAIKCWHWIHLQWRLLSRERTYICSLLCSNKEHRDTSAR